jgi:uncharacterized membrane protein required for colicin V production
LGRLISLIAAGLAGIRYYVDVAEVLQSFLKINPFILLIFGFIIVFAGVIVSIRIIIKFIERYVLSERFQSFNQAIGFLFGSLKGAVIVMLVLWSFELLPIHSWVDKLNRESLIAYALKTARDKTIDIFNWEDPVQKGENFIRDILNPNSTEA